MSDADALAGKTFYRALASPSHPGNYSFIQLYNPPDSGKDVFFDACFVWGGNPTESSEYGILHYATPFDQAPLSDVFTCEFLATRYGEPPGKCQIWAGTYPQALEPQVDYLFQAPPSTAAPHLEKFPEPIILAPGDGIVLWNTQIGLEGKAGLWIRELDAAA